MARAPDRASKHPRAISTQPNPQGASAWRMPAQLADRPARSSRAPKLTQRCQAGADTEPHRANRAAASGHQGICLLGEQRSSSSSPLTSPTPAMKAASQHRTASPSSCIRLRRERTRSCGWRRNNQLPFSARYAAPQSRAAEPCRRAALQSRAPYLLPGGAEHGLLDVRVHAAQGVVPSWNALEVAQSTVLVPHHLLHHGGVTSQLHGLPERRTWNGWARVRPAERSAPRGCEQPSSATLSRQPSTQSSL